MKKIMLACLLFISVQAFSQEKKEEKVEQYCEIVATAKMLSNKVTIEVDYGEERSFWKNNRLKDEDGKIKKFNTVIDALNYMG
ncbi:MAG: hypothetical protein JNM88_17200, partial [Chitinophagaceae bacterium]|nr:hypothetical protein [Chitinophagaceae bacterium]